MPATAGGDIAIGVYSMKTSPDGMGLTRAKICVEEAFLGGTEEELFCPRPVALENDILVKLSDERMFHLEVGSI